MPYLKNIVTKINDSLKANAFKDTRFTDAKFYGITISVPRYESGTVVSLSPMVADDFDNETYAGFDDTYPMVIYHKNLGIQRKADDKQNYGNNVGIIETANMQMIVFAQRDKILLTPEDLDSIITTQLPVSIDKADIATYKLRQVNIGAGNTNFNSAAIYSGEYKGDYSLKPNSILIAINYQVETRYTKECVVVCDDCLTS